MARRNQHKLTAAIAGDKDASMVSEHYADETDGVGDDPEDDAVLDLNPKNSLQTGRRIDKEENPNQEGHSYRDQRVDSRVKFLEEKMMTTRDVEERILAREQVSWSPERDL